MDRAVVDPEGTKRRALEALQALPITRRYEEQVELVRDCVSAYRRATLKRGTPKAKIAELEAELNAAWEEQQNISRKLGAKYAELYKEHLTYFVPKLGEELITDEAEGEHLASQLRSATSKQVVLRSGEVLEDRRGEKVYINQGGKWRTQVVEFLGEKLEGKVEEELTDEERAEAKASIEDQRIAGLSSEDKQKEKKEREAEALTAAAKLRSDLEIMGDPDALEKSQEAYRKTKARIEERYQ